MAHPDRAADVDLLRERLGFPARVAFDMGGAPSRDPDRIWDTARRAWEMHDARADWHLLIQDDAIVAVDLVAGLEQALKYVPARSLVSLYLGMGRPMAGMWGKVVDEAIEREASWIVGPRLMWGVGVLLPTPLIGDMISYCNTQRGATDDMRVGRWGQRSKLETWYTWPSLVDHPDGSSLIGHGGGRTAWGFQPNASNGAWGGPVVRWK